MAKKIIINLAQRFIDVYNVLDSVGLVSSVVGTPSSTSLVFSTPLLPNGLYLRFSARSLSTHNSTIVEVGTVSETKFTTTYSLSGHSYASTPTPYMYLIYDLSCPFLIFNEYNGAKYSGFYLGNLDNGQKIGFSWSMNPESSSSGVKNFDTDDIYPYVWTFQQEASYNNFYIEQDVRIIDNGGDFLMNGSNLAYVQGIKNVAISNKYFTELANVALFSSDYNTNLPFYTSFKVDLS